MYIYIYILYIHYTYIWLSSSVFWIPTDTVIAIILCEVESLVVDCQPEVDSAWEFWSMDDRAKLPLTDATKWHLKEFCTVHFKSSCVLMFVKCAGRWFCRVNVPRKTLSFPICRLWSIYWIFYTVFEDIQYIIYTQQFDPFGRIYFKMFYLSFPAKVFPLLTAAKMLGHRH